MADIDEIVWDEKRINVFHSAPRRLQAIACRCGGYADQMDSTEAECREFGCGRDGPGNECCARAFECRICGTRYVGRQQAPEME